jgi:hypothetical protein
MALMQEKLYAALKLADVPEIDARDAAVEAAASVTTMKDDIAEMKSEQRVMKWMLGTVVLLQISTFFMVFQIYAHLPK